MGEQEKILASFITAFSDSKKKRIVLYGLGINTLYLLNHLPDWRIVGLMDAQNEGKEYWGLPVLRMDEAAKQADLIVIIARTSVLSVIYSRIRSLNDSVPIYQFQGIPLAQLFPDGTEDKPAQLDWNDTCATLRKEIDAHSVISFDLFDTLVMRKLPEPADLFDLAEQKIIRQGGMCGFCFREKRMEAERLERQKNPAPTIEEIYERLRYLTGSDESQARHFLQTEWEAEKEVVCIREDVCALFRYALNQGKQVLIISDMYWSAKKLTELLNGLGLSGFTELLVSSEFKTGKEDGGLFPLAKKKYGNDILHIGDNERADIQCARQAGLTGMRILSAYDLCLSSPLKALLVPVSSMEDRLWLGGFLAQFLNSPWALHRRHGRLEISTPEALAEIAFSPLICSFLRWMLSSLRGRKPEEAVILFTARDGYFPQKLYTQAIRGKENEYPEGIYFLTSRRAVTVANLHSSADIDELVEQISLTSSYGEILFRFFGVSADADDPLANTRVTTSINRKALRSWLRRYETAILENADEERKNYLNHIDSLSIGNREVYIFDLAVTGTVPTGIERLLKKECRLICFSTWNIPNRFYRDEKRILSFLGNYGYYDSEHFFLQVYKLFEILFTPESGSLIHFGTQGAVFSKEQTDTERYSRIRRMQDHLLSMIPERLETTCGLKLADAFLSLLSPNCSFVDQTLRTAFCYDDHTQGECLHEIWDAIVGMAGISDELNEKETGCQKETGEKKWTHG